MSPSFTITIPATVASRAGEIGLSFYTPEDYVLQRRAGWKYPVVVNFHGGGFTLGKATDDARWSTALVLEVDAVVVSVDYRLAPEYPFPTAVEDGVDAIHFLVERAEELGLDVRRFALSGFSAGGNLAFTVPLMLHEQLHRLDSMDSGARECGPQSSGKIVRKCSNPLMDLKIVALIAWYPPTDYTTTTAMRRATCTRPQLAMPNFFVNLFDASYIDSRSCDRSHPFLSPGIASEGLLRLLPNDIILFTCEWDMLRAEAETFGIRLRRELRKTVTHTVIPQAAHAWDRTTNPFHIDNTVLQYYRQACTALEYIFKTSP